MFYLQAMFMVTIINIMTLTTASKIKKPQPFFAKCLVRETANALHSLGIKAMILPKNIAFHVGSSTRLMFPVERKIHMLCLAISTVKIQNV